MHKTDPRHVIQGKDAHALAPGCTRARTQAHTRAHARTHAGVGTHAGMGMGEIRAREGIDTRSKKSTVFF